MTGSTSAMYKADGFAAAIKILSVTQILMNAIMTPMIVITHVPIPSVDTHAHVAKDISYTMTVQLAMVRSDAY